MEYDKLLKELNHVEAEKYVGGVVFVSIIMTIGIIGNFHVLIVYTFRMKPSNHRIFILMLAVLDFITCCVGMPFILVDLRNPWTFTMTAACKILRFINYFICISSALLLIVIAAERYRKICVPLGKQMSKKMAKLSCVLVMAISSLLSWPAPVLYGRDTIDILDYNITGVRCYTEDRFKDTKYMAYFNSLLIFIAVAAFVVLVVLYTLIWRVIKMHSRWGGQNQRNGKKDEIIKTISKDQESTEITSDSSTGEKGSANDSTAELKEIFTRENFKPNRTSDNRDKENEQKAERKIAHQEDRKKMDRAKRMTLMFLLITIVFFVSYLPHLVLKIVTFLNSNFVPSMNFTGSVLYNTFIWCFFINNMANAFIYGFCDLHFRAEVKALYSKLFVCTRR